MRDYSIVPELQAMLGYCRPHGSAMEKAFTRKYVQSLGATIDGWGNWHLAIPNVDGSPSRTLWSSHTDTVHKIGAQQGVVCGPDGLLRLTRRSAKRSHCLGADDTVGVFLMRRMALAGRPGYYVFHYGEEAGCIGSRTIANERGAWLRASFDHAIAFDRRDTRDVITHQMGTRTASDSFAVALAEQLNATDPLLDYEPCDGGAYTDTEAYATDIPECSNLSIGYDGNHSHRETVDVAHVDRLLAALLVLDATALPVDRDPDVIEDRWAAIDHYRGPSSKGAIVLDWARYDALRPAGAGRYDLDCRLYPRDYVDDCEDDTGCAVCGASELHRLASMQYFPDIEPFCTKCGSDWP